MKPNGMNIVSLALAAAALCSVVACNTFEGVCAKEFECQDELGKNLQDDFVKVCAKGADGANQALRENAEKECTDLANAQVALAVCESALDCATLAKARDNPGNESDDACAIVRKGVTDSLEATSNGADCTGIEADDAE
jgi:hypothetical protein